MQLKHLLLVCAIPASFIFSGCEGVDCEEELTGTLTWKNNFSSSAIVEVDGERQTISAGSTATYYDVAEGTCSSSVTVNGSKRTVLFPECITACKTTSLEY